VLAREKNGSQAIGRSRGGLTTKIHALVDALGNPVELMLTPGQAHDLACAEPLIENADPGALIGDKAYDADPFIDTLSQRGITPVIPPRANRATKRAPAILHSTANATSSNASSISSSTSVPSQRAMTNSQEIFLPERSWLPLSSCSTEHRP
jgi:transposase